MYALTTANVISQRHCWRSYQTYLLIILLADSCFVKDGCVVSEVCIGQVVKFALNLKVKGFAFVIGLCRRLSHSTLTS